MAWRAAADAVLVTHLLFIVFVVIGGFVARRRRWLTGLHLTTVAYAFVIEAVGFRCPLTPLEKSLRRSAGEAGYEGGFVEHYIVGIIYPGGLTTAVRASLVIGLVMVTALAYRRPLTAQLHPTVAVVGQPSRT